MEQTPDDLLTTSADAVTALARGLELLRCFSPQAPERSNSELAAETGLPRSTVSRLTRTLVDYGYLRHDAARRRYRVGPSVLALGYAALANLRVRDLARPHLQALADATQALVSLSTRDRLAMMYIENCRPASSMTLRLHVGSHLPLATTSIGRAFLAGLPAAEQAYLCQQLAGREPQAGEASASADTATQQAALQRELERYRNQGYCLSLGEWKRDVNAVAVPLTSTAATDLLVLSISGPAFAVTPQQIDNELAPRLLALARHIEGLL